MGKLPLLFAACLALNLPSVVAQTGINGQASHPWRSGPRAATSPLSTEPVGQSSGVVHHGAAFYDLAQEQPANSSPSANALGLPGGTVDGNAPSDSSTSQRSAAAASPDTSTDSQKSKCDAKKMAELSKAQATAFKGVFYDNNFDYLDDPCYRGSLIGDHFKGIEIHDCTTLDLGGQYRLRQHSENNIRGLGLTGRDDDFLLHRTRLYADLHHSDWLRGYAEYIDAVSNYENFPPRLIEENRSDLLNLFVDAKLYDSGDGKLWGRVGRQELLYGAQRTVSPLDWANTRRTFEGAKLFWRSDDWDVDGFWTQPVVVNPKEFDRRDHSQEFTGIYSTYKGIKNRTVDIYFLRYAEYDGPIDFDFNTIGSRYSGAEKGWLWELEGAYQFGDYGDVDHSAGFFTVGLGREFKHICWQPTVWAWYDWASGSDTIGNGYHHLFAFAHKYLGFMDLFGRRNIEDINFQLFLTPHKRLKLQAWHHIFFLQDGDDVPYNVVMGPSATVPGGSQYLGQELDLLATWTVNPRMDVAVGYSHFWAGEFYETNPTPGLFNGDADFFYTQATVNF
jgi:hypothetical protein